MKRIKLIAACAFVAFVSSNALAEERIDRSQRTNPYPNTPSYAQGGNDSRYDTSNGWSRARSNWWGYGGSDIPTSGYTAPVPPRQYGSGHHESRCGGGKVIVVQQQPQVAYNAQQPIQTNRPNCQRGTTFDGHGCKIIDRRLNKPGGDGYINPCRNGAWYSNGRCVRK